MPPTDPSYSRKNTLSKLEAFEKSGINYKAEFRRNVEILQDAVDSFKSVYADCKELDLNPPAAFEEKYFIRHRMKEILISVTDDVARHCLYHDIKEEGEGNDSEKAFALSPPTRVAFFVKWIANFKPCKLDDYLYSYANKCSDMKKFENANEILAMFVASTIMGLQDETGRVRLLSTFLTDLEWKSFIYQLKYRISHQDALYGFFNRLYYSNPASKELNDDTGKI